MAKVLLERQSPVDIDRVSGKYGTALIVSACQGIATPTRSRHKTPRKDPRVRMMRYLLEKKADPKALGGMYGHVLSASRALAPPDIISNTSDYVAKISRRMNPSLSSKVPKVDRYINASRLNPHAKGTEGTIRIVVC
jgi:hypothetical protein